MPALLQEQLKIKHQQRTGFGFQYQQKGLKLSISGFTRKMPDYSPFNIGTVPEDEIKRMIAENYDLITGR